MSYELETGNGNGKRETFFYTNMKPRLKPVDRKKAKRPLLIDRLPRKMQDRIRAERVAGKTWLEIEQESPTWKYWKKVPAGVRKLFSAHPRTEDPSLRSGHAEIARVGYPLKDCHPERSEGSVVGPHPMPGDAVIYRLPHTNLCRWYDHRVEQVLRDEQKRAAAAHAAADKVAARGFKNLTASVKHALGEAVFEVMNAREDPEKIVAALTGLGHLLAKLDRNEIASRRVRLLEEEAERKKKQFERETNDAARKLEKGRSLTIDDINRIRERTFGLPPIEREATASHPA